MENKTPKTLEEYALARLAKLEKENEELQNALTMKTAEANRANVLIKALEFAERTPGYITVSGWIKEGEPAHEIAKTYVKAEEE